MANNSQFIPPGWPNLKEWKQEVLGQMWWDLWARTIGLRLRSAATTWKTIWNCLTKLNTYLQHNQPFHSWTCQKKCKQTHLEGGKWQSSWSEPLVSCLELKFLIAVRENAYLQGSWDLDFSEMLCIMANPRLGWSESKGNSMTDYFNKPNLREGH